jgi:hypothetical protein
MLSNSQQHFGFSEPESRPLIFGKGSNGKHPSDSSSGAHRMLFIADGTHASYSSLESKNYSITALQHYSITALQHYSITALHNHINELKTLSIDNDAARASYYHIY